jgi:hypothetical protein
MVEAEEMRRRKKSPRARNCGATGENFSSKNIYRKIAYPARES